MDVAQGLTADRAERAPVRFGLSPIHRGTTAVWGARAIYDRRYNTRTRKREIGIDLLWDRQQYEGGSEVERKRLAAALNRHLLPALKRELAKNYLGPEERRLVQVERRGYVILADPKGSHGYLYLCAYKLPIPKLP